jgi:hypothetical protein
MQKHAEWTKSGACQKCAGVSLVADDYCICTRCKSYFCLGCTLNKPISGLDASALSGDALRTGRFAACLACGADMGINSLPFVFIMMAGMAKARSDDMGDGAAAVALGEELGLLMGRARAADVSGRRAEAAELYTRALNLGHYLRSRVPQFFRQSDADNMVVRQRHTMCGQWY